MKVGSLTLSNLKRVPDLERRAVEGSIYEGEERVITFRASTFQFLIDTVKAVAGGKATRTIFYLVGLAIARRAFESYKDELASDNLEQVMDGVLSLRGWGRLVSLRKTEASSGVAYECTFQDCIMCSKRTAHEPICDIIRGIFVGWLESFVGNKSASSVETECKAMGRESCVFKINFPE